MTLSEKTKKSIEEEFLVYNKNKKIQYNNKTFEERQELGQFFTPPVLSIRMLEEYDDCKGTICDPAMGNGNLLAAAIIAGFNPKLVYGIEYDETTLEMAKERLSKLGVPVENLIQGDSTTDTPYNILLNKKSKFLK